MTMRKHSPPRLSPPALALAIAISVCAAQSPAIAESWSPVASERLMKLPGDSLEKAIEHDYAKSGLAQELISVDEEISFKLMTLGDLKQAVERAEDGEARTNLQHQFLEAKSSYLQLMREQQLLREKRAKTKLKLYEKLFARLRRQQRSATPEQQAFVNRQRQARQRMERTSTAVDTTLFATGTTADSKYSAEYRKNLTAIEQLSAAIRNHPMNAAPMIEDRVVSRDEYLRQLIAQSQGELAVIEQEQMILGHMAKLVSLDAMALAEGVAETEAETRLATAPPTPKQVSDVVDLFTNQ